MKSMVIDTSVVVKWIFPQQVREDHIPQALSLLRDIKRGSI